MQIPDAFKNSLPPVATGENNVSSTAGAGRTQEDNKDGSVLEFKNFKIRPQLCV